MYKGKALPQHTYRGGGGKGVSSYSFTTSALDGMSGQRHAPAALYPLGKPNIYSIINKHLLLDSSSLLGYTYVKWSLVTV
jgi:hypothetical protein